MKRNATFKVLLMFIVGLFLSVNTFAQQIVVKGIVKDTTGEPIIGANVIGEFYQFNLSSCIRQQNSLTAQFVSFSLSNLANIFYPPQFLQ